MKKNQKNPTIPQPNSSVSVISWIQITDQFEMTATHILHSIHSPKQHSSHQYTTPYIQPLQWEHATTKRILFLFHPVLLQINPKNNKLPEHTIYIHVQFYQGIYRSTGVS
jgi:hypothetical protein